MKKKLLSVILCMSLMTSVTVNCADLSDWAVEPYRQASSAGLISYNVAANKLTDSITREEFCTLSVNLYERLAGEELSEPDILPFDDSDSMDVAKAYNLGIVSGNEKGEFCPDNLITRQELSKMLVNTLDLCGVTMTVSEKEKQLIAEYSDFASVSEWAEDYVSKAMKYGIINGTSATTIDPLGNATREQAITMSNRAYSSFATMQISENTPEIISPEQSAAFDSKVNIRWAEVSDASEYYIIIKNKDLVPVYQDTTRKTSTTVNKSSLDRSGMYTLVIGAKTEDGEFFSMPVDFYLGSAQTASTPEPTITPSPAPTASPTAQPPVSKPTANPTIAPTASPTIEPEADTDETFEESDFQKLWDYALTSVTPEPVPLEEKEARVFPEGKRFESKEEADAYMVEVEIPVWLISGDKKVSSTKTVTVNSALAEDVKAIFEEIYALPQQYPIKSVSSYSWRNTSGGRLSQHSYGTCIDINPTENYYVSSGGTAYSGSYWKPGEDPYSIDLGAGIIEIFAKYGWAWGGNAWPSSHDYMHFSYLGN